MIDFIWKAPVVSGRQKSTGACLLGASGHQEILMNTTRTGLHERLRRLHRLMRRRHVATHAHAGPLADTTRNLSNALGILDAEHVYHEAEDIYLIEGSNVTFRATFLIDESGKVFHESVNDMPLGRNVKEYLRLIDAYTHVQKYGEVCPANWEEGKEAMHADRKSTADYLAKH